MRSRRGASFGPARASGVSALQEWARGFDVRRDWDRVAPTDTAVHLMEEAGEVARAVLTLSGYKASRRGTGGARRELGLELADVLFLCLKLANQYGLDLARSVEAKIAANERRFPPGTGRRELARYLAARRSDSRVLAGPRRAGRHLSFGR